MADFKKALAKTILNEGGWSEDSDDTGGKTYKGISYRANPNWAGWSIIEAHRKDKSFPKCLDSIPELQVYVAALYKPKYWDVFKGDSLTNQRVAEDIFDSGVNNGVGTAIKQAQQAVGLKVTGVMDQVTLITLNRIQ